MRSHSLRLISRLIVTPALLCVLASCTIMRTPQTVSPICSARRMLPRSEANAPLTPGTEPADESLAPRSPKEPLVLLTISGGGSRSAYYAARVMEELSCMQMPSGKGSVLDNVRVMSTVSAGSLAAAWYLAHFDERKQPDFFLRFKNAMAVNLQWRTYGHMAIFPPLALELVASPLTRTDLLASEIEKLLTDGNPVTFNDLRSREMRRDDPAPIFIANATIYNSGQRLVMSNLPALRFPSLASRDGSRINMSQRDAQLWTSLVQPVTFEDLGSDIGSFRLAHAVAASAAFPVVLAPVRLQVFPEYVPPVLQGRVSEGLLNTNYIHVADGGLYENEGIDPLLSILRTLPKDQPVLLIVVEASQRMETVGSARNKVWDPMSVIWRMYDIGSMRPVAFYNVLAKQFHNPDKLEAVVIQMEGNDPQTEKTLRNIPTMFKLSRAHRTALDTAASQNVQIMAPDIYGAICRLTGMKAPRTAKPAGKPAQIDSTELAPIKDDKQTTRTAANR